MRHRVRLLLVLLVGLSTLVLAPVARGWQNGASCREFGAQTTQQWILSQAHSLAVEAGADWMDLSIAMAVVDDPDTRYHDFRYHRYERWGGRDIGAAPSRVASCYDAALNALRNGDQAEASEQLGLLVHYFTDACDPLHTAQSSEETRRGLHRSYEQRVMGLLNRTEPNRVNRSAESVQVAEITTSARAYMIAQAIAAHADYRPLVRQFRLHGFGSRVAGITRRTLDRAVVGTASLMVKLNKDKDKDKQPQASPTPTPSPTTAPDPDPTPTPMATLTVEPSPDPTPTPASATVTVDGTTPSAIDAAIAVAEGRGADTTVFFPAGSYSHGTSLTIPDGISLKGAGIGETSLNFTLIFGSGQTISEMRVGAAPRTALFSRSGTTARDTTFLHVRFRGGGPVPGVSYDPASTDYVGYNALIQLGGKETTRSASHVSFVECEFERVSGPWVSRYVRGNTVSAWEDNRAGRAHLEYISFIRCHFGVKNDAGDYGALSANVELKTNTCTQYPEFAHNWHDFKFIDNIFERSGDFNIDFTDSSRAWLKSYGLTESGTTDGTPNWMRVPIEYHAGIETGRSVTISGGVIKGCGYTSAPYWTYLICLENPIGATITGVTAYGGNRTQGGMVSASSACGALLTTPLAAWPTPLAAYDPLGMNTAYGNRYTPGLWGDYTPSPYDP